MCEIKSNQMHFHGDGVQADAWGALFERIDSNGDGAITFDEFKVPAAARACPCVGARACAGVCVRVCRCV